MTLQIAATWLALFPAAAAPARTGAPPPPPAEAGRPSPEEPAQEKPAQEEPVRHAPGFSLPGLTGEFVDSLYEARPVTMVQFWASWCVPCMREVPHLNSLAARYEPVGLGLFAISSDDATLLELEQLVRTYGMRYTIVKADTDVVSGFGGLESFPTTFLVDQKGRIVSSHVGASEEIQHTIEARIRTLLAAAGRRLPDPSR